MTVFVLAFLLPIQVFAQSNDSFQLDTQGNVTLTSSHAAREGISSLQFSLEIESNSADKVEFQFSPNLAKVSEFRYHEDTGILNVYIADTEALFPENSESLTLGRVVVLDSSQNAVLATVSVVADSLQYVYGSELRQAEELQVPEAVTINGVSGDSGGSQNPSVENNSQGSGGSSSDPQGSGGSSSDSQSSEGFSSGSQVFEGSSSDSQGSDSLNNAQTSNKSSQSSNSSGMSSTSQAENYARLSQTFENARGFKEEDYSSESYEALRAAMIKAEEVLGDPNATSEEIDEALIELENAIGALVAKEEVADDSQQSSEQETGDASEQTVDESLGIKEEDVSNGSRLPMFLLITGVLVLLGCAAAVVGIKIRNDQSYEDD